MCCVQEGLNFDLVVQSPAVFMMQSLGAAHLDGLGKVAWYSPLSESAVNHISGQCNAFQRSPEQHVHISMQHTQAYAVHPCLSQPFR